jgi:hypothetical protein
MGEAAPREHWQSAQTRDGDAIAHLTAREQEACMKTNQWGAAIVLVAGCAVGVYAQTGSSTSQSSSTADKNAITVTGCLERASQSGMTGTSGTAGTSGSTATSSSASGWVLSNAKPAGSSGSSSPYGSSSPSSTTGTSGSTVSGSSGTSYFLDGSDTELSRHAGHEIEVIGTLESSSSSTGASSASSTTPSTSSSTTGQQRLRVTSVKMISSTCPSK